MVIKIKLSWSEIVIDQICLESRISIKLADRICTTKKYISDLKVTLVFDERKFVEAHKVILVNILELNQHNDQSTSCSCE